jgi:hypothetical protein
MLTSNLSIFQLSGTLAHVKSKSSGVLRSFLSLFVLSVFSIGALAQPVPPSPRGPPAPAPSGPPVHLVCFYIEKDAAGKQGYICAIPQDAPITGEYVLYPNLTLLKIAIQKQGIHNFDVQTNLSFAAPAGNKQRPLTSDEIGYLQNKRPPPLPPAPPPIVRTNRVRVPTPSPTHP